VESQIRFLVESYYDIQKLRIETFNRIVAYVKANMEKFSQKMNENQIIRADKSHSMTETHDKGANVSQSADESQFPLAKGSRYLSEAQKEKDKSHVKNENLSEFANASQGKDEAPNTIASTLAPKPSVIAHEIVSGKRKPPDEIKELVWYHNSLYETEKGLAKRLDAWSKHHPIRINFLSKIRGIGPVLSSGIIAWLSPISRFPNISKLWSYCGLAPGQKRKRGLKLGYNPRLKTLMWKVAASFEKQKPEKSRYRRLYEEKKRYYLSKREDLKKAIEKGEKGAKLHVRLLAMRFTVKRFLADLWVQWRKLEGLPITKPYAHTVLGHEEYEEWTPDITD